MKNLNFWLKNIDPYLAELDEIPLFRGEKFSFTDLAASLKKELSLEDLEISSPQMKWQTKEEILQEFGEDPHQLCLIFTPLLGNVYLLIGKEELKALTSYFLLLDEKSQFPSFILEEGFYRHLILLTLEQIKKSPTFDGLTPKIVEKAEIKSEQAFCIHLKLKIQNKISLSALVAITPDFRKSWNDFFLSKKSITSDLLRSAVEVPLTAIAGSISLKREELESLEKGDFVVLDTPNLTLKDGGRAIILKLNETPVFIARMEENKILIQEYANYHEEDEIMEEKDMPQNEPLSNQEFSEGEELPLSTTEKNISIEDLPVKITVELAKISITLEKLTSLQPGNILHISSTIDSPVKLTVSGKQIGLGELIQVGETLGIRILQLG
jgi:flagellar motor switch protein FliN